MYPSKGGNAYGQQPYASQQVYGQIPGAGYTGNPVGTDAASQLALASRQSMMGATQETDLSAYRAHTSQLAQYGGPYASVYGAAALSSAQQVGGVSAKGAVSSNLQGQTGYPSESSKFSSGALGSGVGMNNDDYLAASNRGYAQTADQFSTVKSSDYPTVDRRQYGEQQGAYIGRELQSDAARRYTDSVAFGHQQKSEMHDQLDQVALLRQQQLLKAQALQSASDMRQADYLSARAAPIHPGAQELSSYGGRMDADPRSLYAGQHTASILGGAPRRNVDDLIYAQGSAGAGYGVGLPPGRDYGAGKGLRGPSFESDYQGNVLSRGHASLGVSMSSEHKDDRSAYRRELEIRDEERRRELIREREKEREREDREREREKERERERDRLREQRDRERERDRKRGSELRRERTPPRTTRDRRGSSLTRAERPLRRVTPRREAVHRHRSPVKEKKREYTCKVYPFCLVDNERDYLSLNKRYPRLSISPDFSKVVLYWPKEKLNLSLHTPVSFEHDFVEVDSKIEETSSISLVDESSNTKGGNTVWNAKVILMSGISSDALEELSSEKISDKKIIHLNNTLKFAVIRKDHSFMAIGGQWDSAKDGGDPSVDNSCLIQTALRYVKDLTQLNLQNCLSWNRFVEIHYNRVGKDGLFSHKEISVLFVPNLSECLPSLDLWQSRWLTYMKELAERERASKLKRSSEKKEAVHGEKSSTKTEKDTKGKVEAEGNIVKDEKVDKMDVEGSPADKTSGPKKGERSKNDINDTTRTVIEQKGKVLVSDVEQIDKKIVGTVGTEEKPNQDGSNGGASEPAVENIKPIKRKIVRKRVVAKKAAVEVTADMQDEKLVVKDAGVKPGMQENAVLEGEGSANPVNVKTFVRKRIIKKVIASSAQKEDSVIAPSAVQTVIQSENENELQVDVEKGKEPDSSAAVQGTTAKTTGKKKVIKRIIRRKVSATEEKNANAIEKKAAEKDGSKTMEEANKKEDTKDQVGIKDDDLVVVPDSGKKIIEDSKTSAAEEENKGEKKIKEEKKVSKSDDVSKEARGGSKSGSEPEDGRKKEGSRKDRHDDGKDRTKDEKLKKAKDSKSDSKQTHKGIVEVPPKHPGFFLKAKQPKESKVRIRSMSLSLDGILDYNDKDVEEPTFELSLFAESLNEMLQYEMGTRILSFLEKLNRRYAMQKKQQKRQRDENPDKKIEKEKSAAKRRKIDDGSSVENESLKSGAQDDSNVKPDEKMAEDVSASEPIESKNENKTDDDDVDEDEEDPEEIIEDDQEMAHASPSEDGAEEPEDKTEIGETKKHKETEDEGRKMNADEKNDKPAKTDEKPEKEKDDKQQVAPVKEEVVNKELLQAFRFFDLNQVGYLKVEDLRCIIHNLGKFLSHRDVKEMVKSALSESGNARDNRVLYKKLVRITDI